MRPDAQCESGYQQRDQVLLVDAPKPLFDAVARGDCGSTIDPVLKTQPVNFLINLDTTGDNSGSPALNARGERTGLNFDRHRETVGASGWFDPRCERAIHVDLRRMRWLMASVYPALLLREMELPIGMFRASSQNPAFCSPIPERRNE